MDLFFIVKFYIYIYIIVILRYIILFFSNLFNNLESEAMKPTKFALNFILFFSFCVFAPQVALANNLNITNVSLKDRTPSSNTVVVNFDLAWENSWKTKINHDAIWLTVRLYNPSVTPTDKKLCEISASGLNPVGSSVGSNSHLEIYVPADKKGAFIRPADYGVNAAVTTANAQLTIDYSTCGFTKDSDVYVSVYGLEMVLIPQGAFYVGDYNTSTAALDEGSADSDPWYISSASALSVSNVASNGYRYVSAGNAGEDPTGASFTLPADYPKGYKAFYAMKYEITEGQWVEFINSLPSNAARTNHDLTDGSHKGTDTVKYRNTVSCSGATLTCSSQRPVRAASYLTWMDLLAFLDWDALRPMTELEFEKSARGPLLPLEGEFAWGATDIIAAASLSAGNENGQESVVDAGANANFNNITLTGGDTANGSDYAQGPLRSGIFATNSSDRVTAGAGYYGIMELSGNLRERVVTIGNTDGRLFLGKNGDGVLSTLAGYEGNANETDWPGIDAIATRGVTGANGSGLRGGGWDDQSSGDRLRISDRTDAANASTSAFANTGGRGVRTYDGN